MDITKAKPIGKGILWTIFTIFFGLLQLWLVVANSLVINSYQLDINRILMDGTLLFFTSAVVSSICTDHYLTKNSNLGKLPSSFIYFIYPTIVLCVSVWLFSLNFYPSEEDINLELLRNIQLAVIVSTVLYAIMTKSIMFSQEDLRKNKEKEGA